jgi:hypothetical protein
MAHDEARTMNTAVRPHFSEKTDRNPVGANTQADMWKLGQRESLIIVCCCIIAIVVALDATILVPLLPVRSPRCDANVP